MNARFLRSLSCITVLWIAGIAAAQDVITVGNVTATGPTVDVPVSIRETGGTPLGVDRPAGSKIQSFSIKVMYAPASAVQSVTFSRAGITASLTPAFETSPSSAGAISLLDTFDEGSNPIPFTLNASAPGNLVAHLVFTLSASAAPGTSIALTLDSNLTQLTDTGGSAVTKETTANGQLALVDGSIAIPVPSLTAAPNPLEVATGGSENLRITSSTGVIRAATVTLSSSHPEFATVPPSMNIPAGQTRIDVPVTGVAVGSTTITATLPASMGGASTTATVNVVQSNVQCVTPAAPQIAAPQTAASGAAYSVTWAAVANATEYSIEEATDISFAAATTKTVSGTTASYTHTVQGNALYFYRVRARNHAAGCDLTSAASNVVGVLVQAPAGPVQQLRILPVVGSVQGQAGSNFKTSLQLFNPYEIPISGNVVLHRAGTADVLLPYSLAAGRTVSYDDLLQAMNATGIGTADILGDAGSALPVASTRVFNDAGAAGTSGLSEEAMPASDALHAGDAGSLIAPNDFTRFRFNIGLRSLQDGASFTITVRDANGQVLKTVDRSYGPAVFTQLPSGQMLDGLALTGGESLTFLMTSGSAFIYGATTDNTTNDPSMQLARRRE